MRVSVETLKRLKRKVTVSIPAAKVDKEVDRRLIELANKVKVDGFRPGKAPVDLIKKRYTAGVREDVQREMVQSTLGDALKQNDLTPAGRPTIEPEEIESGKDFTYSA